MSALPLTKENNALRSKADKIDSEIRSKALAMKNTRPKLINQSMFQKRSKSNIKVESNLFKLKTFDPEPIKREQTKECTFKPVINDSSMVKNYVSLLDRTYPKKEVQMGDNMEKGDLDQLIKEQGNRERACLPADEWNKKDKVTLSEKASKVSLEPPEEEKSKRNWNPNFYAEKFEWLKGVHRKIREEQLERDQDNKTEGTDVLNKTKGANEELLKANLDFFERLEKEKKERKQRAEELSKETYNYTFRPAINERSRLAREDDHTRSMTPRIRTQNVESKKESVKKEEEPSQADNNRDKSQEKLLKAKK